MWFLEDVLACIRKVAYFKICLEHCTQDQTFLYIFMNMLKEVYPDYGTQLINL
jgi:hypothetical protein